MPDDYCQEIIKEEDKLRSETNYSLLAEEAPIYVFKVIRLNPKISRLNFFCCLAYLATMIFGFASLGLLQPLIILDKNYFNVSQDNAGTTTSMILVLEMTVKILVTIPCGHLSDKLGRKTMIFYGAFSFLASCLLVPFVTSIFPGFMVAKALFANAAAGLSTVPLLADYIADESKGRAAGVSAMMLGVAAILANIFLKVLFYADVSLGSCYAITGIVVFTSLLLISFGLKGGKYYIKEEAYNDNLPISSTENEVPILENVKEAFKILIGNGWLVMGAVLQMLGSSDFIVFFTFMSLYIKSLFPTGTDDNTENIYVNNLQTLIFSICFFATMTVGYLIDKKGKIMCTSLFALLGGACSFILISISHAPYVLTLDIGAAIFGGTIPGLFVISSYLGIKNYPAEKRGIMVGLMSMLGYMGYFIIAFGGGIIYDRWRRDGPFLICTGLLIMASILITIIYEKMIKGKGLHKIES